MKKYEVDYAAWHVFSFLLKLIPLIHWIACIEDKGQDMLCSNGKVKERLCDNVGSRRQPR